jgi:hypothetical protein
MELLILSLLILPQTLRAQGVDDLPCGDETNPFDTPCPLDSWVIILAIVAVIMTCFQLRIKAKGPSSLD